MRIPGPLLRGAPGPLGAAAAALVLLTSGCSDGSGAANSSTAAAEAAQYASGKPPAAATMICSTEIQGEIADALNVPSIPSPTPTWADHVYTCSHALPGGPLVLAVRVTPSDKAARDQLETTRARFAAAEQEPGLGERAYSNPGGVVVAVKDNLELTVDATALPDDLGGTHEKRLDFARVVAAGVFNCWTGST